MRSAGSTAETTPRTVEPAGTSTRPFCIRSATVVASNRCSTFAVPELSVVPRRTSSSCPAGTTPYALLLTSVGVVFAVVDGVFDVGGTYTGALVVPDVPLVVAPHATLPPTTPITPAIATSFFTADMGVSPPAIRRQTRSTGDRSNENARLTLELWRCSSAGGRALLRRLSGRSSGTTARRLRMARAFARRSPRLRFRQARGRSAAPRQERRRRRARDDVRGSPGRPHASSIQWRGHHRRG